MSLFQKKEAYLGIDIGSRGIKVVELKKTKGRPQLWTYGMLHHDIDIHVDAPDTLKKSPEQQASAPREEKMEKDKKKQKKKDKKNQEDPHLDLARIDEYGDLLAKVIHKSKANTRRATASLPVSQVFHAVITLPKVDQKEIDHHVRAKVKKMLSSPIDQMQIAHQVIPPDPHSPKTDQFIRVLVTAAPRYLVSFYSAIFQKAGLQLEELETEAFALERSLVGKDPATVMVVDVGAERTNFFIVDQGLPITHRSIHLGGKHIDADLSEKLGVGMEHISQIKKDISQPGKVPIDINLFLALFDPIVKEIQYSIDLFIHQTGNEQKKVEKIILTGGGALFPPIAKILSESFSMNVFIGDPWARIVYQQGMKPILDEISPKMSVSIGLAMRNIV